MLSYTTLTSSLVSNDPSEISSQPSSISVSSDGRRFVLGSFSGMRVYVRENDAAIQSSLVATELNNYALADGDVLVAISPDGSTIAAKFEGETQDSIKIYALNMTSATAGSLTLQATFTSSTRGFGEALSFSNDGNLLAVGFPSATVTNNQSQTVENSGSVLIYSRSGSTWSLSKTISNPNQGLEDYFGWDVSLSNDGDTLAIGSVGEENTSTTRTGAVYIYNLSTDTLVKKITADECNAGTYFGSSVSLAGNGQRVAIAAAGKDDTAYSTGSQDYNVVNNKPLVMYKLSGETWSLEHSTFITDLTSYFYNVLDVKMSNNSNSMVALSTKASVTGGKTHRDYYAYSVYNYDGVQWTGNGPLISDANYSLGYSSKPAMIFLPNYTADTSGQVSLVQVSGLTDLVAPTISDTSIVAKDQTYSAVTLVWSAAVDDISSAASMRYDIRYSTSNNMSTLALAEANGTLSQTVTDVHSSTLEATVSDLALNSTYYFTIIAKDLAGNKIKYDTISSATLADLTPPVPATDGAPISYTSTKTSVTLTWPFASDNVTQQPLIQYAVYRVPIFTAGYTGSVATTESMGTLLMSYTANTATYTDSSLLPGSLYGYNVIAMDASGNKVAYNPVSATTQADDIAPTVENKTITFSEVGYFGYKINWNSASDDFSSRASIYYLVYESNSNNIATITNAEANGTVVAQFFGADTATQFFSITGKSQNQQRYYNVIARDAAGNKLIYTSASVSTLTDTTGPTYSSEPTVTADYSSITVSYSAAQDDLTSSQNIQYALYRLPASSTSISYIESYGTLVRDYLASTADIVVPNLTSGTTYHFALLGKDESGNKTLYYSFSKTTLLDATAPIPGASGLITKTNMTPFGFTMSWSRATDDITNALDLEYAVYYSLDESSLSSLEAIANADGNTGIEVAFTKDLTTANISLVSSMMRYYTVVVRDSRGNRAKYQTVSNRNSSDTSAPVPGSSGILTLTPNGYNAVTIQYGLALDNFSHFTQNQYKIVISPLNNISTVADAEANGIVMRDWGGYNAGSYDVIVPIPGQFYFFNVIVRDTEGNKAVYVSKAARSQVDTTSPTVTNAVISLITNSISTATTQSPTLRIGWNQATDNQTSQSGIKYSIYLAPGNPSMSTVQEIEGLSNVRKWTVMGSEGSEFQFPAGTVAISTQYSINIIAEDLLGNKTPYSKITFSTPGDIYPPSITNPTLTVSSRTSSSIKVMWSAASDVLSPSSVQYDLYYSTSNNISSVENILQNGILVISGTYVGLGIAATNGYTITGLTDGTPYYINVITRDGSGNRSAYTALATSTLNESIPPVLTPSSLIVSSVADTSISVSWTPATDNKTASNLLEYAVYRSTSQMSQSVASIEAGTKILDWTANINSYTATSLSRNTRYFFGVVVRDQAGNKSVYAPVNALTLNDTSAPLVPQVFNGNISWSTNNSEIYLSAHQSSDNVTAGQNLVYRIYRSLSNNITTVADMLANGTYIGNGKIPTKLDWNTYTQVYDASASIDYTDRNLPANTGYYYNFMVVDQAGNRAAYTPVFAKTSASFTLPVVGGSGKINITVSGSGALNLSWSPASNANQNSSDLEYAVYYATRITNTAWNLKNEFPPMSDPWNMSSRAQIGQITVAAPFTQNMTSFSIQGLSPAEEYMVNVVVRGSNSFSSLAAYNATRVWTLSDTAGPTPGASGTLTTSYINDSGFVVSWVKASDDYSPQNRLRYEVRVSASNNIGTVDSFKNGMIVMPFTTDINNATVSNLQPGTQYYVNVMVMDASGNKSVYQTQTVTTAPDIEGPTPLLSTLSFSQIGKQSMRVTWGKATDRSTAREDIEYALYMAYSSSHVGTVNQIESAATQIQSYLPDTDYAIVTDLVPGFRYHFNVIAKDKFGNKTAYTPAFADTLEDNIAPTPGANGELLTTHVGQTSVSLSWAHAVDDLPDQDITYILYKSLSNNIATASDAENNGTTVVDMLETNSYTVTGLNPSSKYYFNVVAYDQNSNAAAYNMISVDTIVDTTVPSPGNSGIVNASMVTGDSLVLNWTKGTDNITLEGELQYAVYMSSSDNMTDLPATLSNGTKVRDFARNISLATVSKLQPLTTYYFNVVVRDSFGNMSAYNAVSATTLADTTGPTPGGGGAIIFNSVDKDSMIVTWNPAEDNTASGSQIQYQLRMAMSNLGVAPDFSTVASTEANGTIVKAYSNDSFALVSNLLSNTTYYFNVIAKDAAGNKSVYVASSQKTANSLVEIPTQAVEVNQPVVIASNRDEIKTLPAVAMHPTLSKPSNWKKVHMIYKSTVSNKRVVVVITDFSQMSGQFITQDTEQFAIHKIIVEDENNNFVAVSASSIMNSESWSISVT